MASSTPVATTDSTARSEPRSPPQRPADDSLRPSLRFTGATTAVLRPFAGEDVLASPDNIASWRAWLTRGALSERDRANIRAALSRMEAHPNQLVELFPDTVIQRDTVYQMPRRIAVLVDRGCASSCEDLVLEARQSSKVVIVGPENTAGVHDYGNLRKVYLPGWRQMMVPTSWARGARIDFTGLAPSVHIPKDDPDPVEFARRYLRWEQGGH